ncbi:extracellular catalytic domain type 1 short-chain-length polyhydroxyalkanoate depolymerase [Undibacterium terreum]|uniref:Esterase n=1 Tax=Undibacterium terreum TaxID=1224302 RepID=A0A916UDB3_9BURK|nr:PHB depolymerase family esterase [Undibacterium terreum]GGC68828.1 esterase [Undibacterium terreum]
MKINQDMFAPMKFASRILRSKSPSAATLAIQKALQAMLPAAERASNTRKDGNENAGNTNFKENPPSMRNIDLPAKLVSPQTVPPLAERQRPAIPNFFPKLFGGLSIPSPFDESWGQLGTLSDAPAAPADLEEQDAEGQQDGGRFIEASYTNDAGTRSYKLYIPGDYHGQPLPLVVMLHGCTQNPDDFAAGTRMNGIAGEQPCFVAYPAQSQAANGSKCWNWFHAMDQQRDQGEPSIIAGITREIIDQYAIDPRQVFIAGMSAGGAMSVIMGSTYPDLYAAVGIHSGLPYAAAQDLPSALSAMKGRGHHLGKAEQRLQQIPVIVFHGDNDSTVSPRNSDHIIEQHVTGLAENPIANDTVEVESGRVAQGHAYTRTIHNGPDGKPVAEQWLVHGAGHAWSGGSQRGSYTDPKGPDATREMMRFFSTHPHPDLRADSLDAQIA